MQTNQPEKLLLPLHNRRTFINAALKAAGASTLSLSAMQLTFAANHLKKTYTVDDVIQLILKEIPGAPFKQTVDTIKSGSGSQQVTGIVTTMFATVPVIKQAASLNANFIIAHEPTFYNHTDDTNWVQPNEVLQQKLALLKEHNMAVWRFHDYWHSHRPDGIFFGVIKQAGWEKYYKEGERMLKIPSVSLKEIITQLKQKLGISTLRFIGDINQSCENIGLMPGAAGGQAQVSFIEKYKPDVLIVGEVHEWETAEYVRDARAQGAKTALIVLGHSVSEEPGMEWLVEWLQPKLQGIKVTHIASGNPFTWM